MLVVVDLGNSALKFGAFDGDRLIATERVEGGRNVASGVIPFSYFSVADEVVVAASAPDQVPHLLERSDRPVRVLDAAVQNQIESPYDVPTELGVDRIAALFGGLALHGGPCIVVDAGTAITVDAIHADGRVEPVAIAPGLTTSSRGLKLCAPHLPWPGIGAGDVAVPAKGTAESLRAGFLLGTCGLVDRLVEAARAALSGAEAPSSVPAAGGIVRVLLTGGDAALLGPHLATPHTLHPDLVLHGIRDLHARFPA